MKSNTQGTRREFIKTFASIGAASALTGVWGSRVYAQGSDKIRVGLVGCGGRGTGAGIIDCAQAAPGVELVAIGDIFPHRVAAAPARIKANLKRKGLAVDDIYKVTPDSSFHGWDAHEKVIRSNVDMVIFATPPFFRPMQLKACVAAGKHAFIEKPIATDPVGVRSVMASAELAKQKGLTIVAGTQMRRAKHLQALMQRLHNGDLGEIFAGQSVRLGGGMLGWGADKERKSEWSDMEWHLRRWLFYTWLSGDFIVEMHVHNLDLINWAMNAHPVSCLAQGGRLARTKPIYGNVHDHISVQYEYPGGVRVTHLGRQMDKCSGGNGVNLQGTKGKTYFDFGNATIEGAKPFKYDGPSVNPAVQEYADMITAIRANRPINEGRQVAESTMTALMGRMSAYTGRSLKWSWVMNQSKLDLSPPALAFTDVPERPVAIPGIATLI